MVTLCLPKQFPTLVFFILIATVVFYIDRLAADQITFETTEFVIAGQTYRIDIAKSQRQRLRGLMNRKYLSEDSAMLFIYPETGNHRIWMKNTLIPLNVVWIDDKEKVIHIERLEPCTVDPCPSYGSSVPSRYIIEFHADFKALAVGSHVPGIRALANH